MSIAPVLPVNIQYTVYNFKMYQKSKQAFIDKTKEKIAIATANVWRSRSTRVLLPL